MLGRQGGVERRTVRRRVKLEGLPVGTGKLSEAVRSYIVSSPHPIEKIC